MAGSPSSMDVYAQPLADGICAALPWWVEACVARVLAAAGLPVPEEIRLAASAAGERAGAEVGPRIRALLAADIDDQRTTPLAIIRFGAVGYPTEVLQAAGVPAPLRDAFAARAFPADIYDLAPASFADLSADLVGAGTAWGAAKAFEHRARHRS